MKQENTIRIQPKKKTEDGPIPYVLTTRGLMAVYWFRGERLGEPRPWLYTGKRGDR